MPPAEPFGRTGPARMADVARRAGVSKKTVSAVVNGVGQVSEQTRERVRAAIAELDFRPHPAARRLSAGLSGSITLAVGHLASADTAALVSAISAAAERAGIGVVCLPSTSGEIPSLDSGSSDGLILVPTSEPSRLPRHIPTVVAGIRPSGHQVDQIIASLPHMLDQARRELNRAAAPLILVDIDDVDVVPKDFIPDALTAIDSSAGAGYGAVVEGWQRRTRRAESPGGIISIGSGLAIGATHALRELGLAVPTDMPLVAIGSGLEAEYADPSISTISPDLTQMASAAIDRLLARIDGDAAAPRRLEVPAVLTRRESTGVR